MRRLNCRTRQILIVLGITFFFQADGIAQIVVVPNQVVVPGPGGVLMGEGAFLRGAGSFNLNTARADSINLNTMIRWKQDIRNDIRLAREERERKEAKKKQRIEEVKQRRQERERQLRLDPSPSDIQNGEALNALFFDLTDPDITSNDWMYRPVPMPAGLSVKDLIFNFTPLSTSTAESRALSRGVVALSRLKVEGSKWPTVLKQEELTRERREFEIAYAKLSKNLIENKPINNEVVSLDHSLDSLKSRVNSVVPVERDYRKQALKEVKDLHDATRMFDAATVDYSREILIDTQDHDATTVGELIGFMLKYRLQFATAENIPAGRELYRQVYELLRTQADAFNQPAPVPESKFEQIMRTYGNSRNAAASRLIEAFDRRVHDMEDSLTLTQDDKGKKIDIVKAEKTSFMRSGGIPFSTLMRQDALNYLNDLKNAEDAASKAIANLKNVDNLAEQRKLLSPSVVGKWSFVSQIDRNLRFTWTLYSNGSINQGSSKWTLNQTNLVGTHPSNKAPGGAWIDTCMIDENGQRLFAKNQLGHPFKGSRID